MAANRAPDSYQSTKPLRLVAQIKKVSEGVFVERYVFVIILAMIAIAIILPLYVFFAHFGGEASRSGPFGDTIGGLAGPIMAMLSTILIFLSFKKQAESNRLLISTTDRSEALNRSILILTEVSSEISRIEQEYNGAHFKVKEKDGTYTLAQGFYAFEKMLKAFRKDTDDPASQLLELERYLANHATFLELCYIKIQCQTLFIQIDLSIHEKVFQHIAYRKLKLFYCHKVNFSIDRIEDFICEEIYSDRASGQAAIAALPDSSKVKTLIVENEEVCQRYQIDELTLDSFYETIKAFTA